MEELSEYEEQIMRIFWKNKRAVVREILEELPDPKPPYTTLASSVKLLEKKGYLSHRTYGKTHDYFPVISQSDYRTNRFNKLVSNFFGGSVENVLSYLVSEKRISDKEVDELQKLIDKYDKE
ncbi:BlaI/MecI/CopY family transcriptional regulator [Algoriphagus sp. NF]|jgi:predicted transcriptional regulator|uniref:BlaI/MecI/CopY family transcriptional regulator n=1 Tax=Algoriphagus marincola TaxID=264027 RepID=A0ABS7N038_9BACT|nr:MULTISPECIES: BlaI/MecI/CopY family transcriptional regulator [Algoriphagus]MBY5949676.1 BlaI/MecI/CopY family transcriptional regulator [Algoriphagus marincola]MDE0558344.1 BlaI/MecI/CopY family transcriptional regulator [Algoriphagus sp. NF]